MKKFRFGMEGFLKLKKMEEDRKVGELAGVIGRIERERSTIRSYQDKVAYYLTDEKAKTVHNLNDMIMIRDYLGEMNKKRKIAERNIKNMQTELREKQKAAADARKNRRVIEILKEKKYSEYLYDLSVEEGKNLDEFNSSRKNYLFNTIEKNHIKKEGINAADTMG